MSIRIETVKFFSCFASAIINDDYSGLTEDGELEVERFFDRVTALFGDGARVVDVEDDHEFTWRTRRDAPYSHMNEMAGDVSTYVLHVPDEAEDM